MGLQAGYAHENEKHGKMNPFILGMYLNQARLNAFITLCHISDLVREKGTVVEDALCTARVLNRLNGFDDPIKSRKVFELVDHQFPMLKSIVNGVQKRRSGGANETSDTDVNTKATDYKQVLTVLLTAIQEKRNQYCHAVSADTLSDKADVQELIRYLEDCFDASVNTVKTRLELYEDDKSANNPQDEVLHLRRFKEKEGKKKAKDNPHFMYAFSEGRSLTDKGLAFLTSLFLEKDDAFKFLSTCGLTGFKRTEEDRYRATPLCYTALRIRLPHPKIRSDDDRNGLLLDMLNDLRKCPRELFDLLSKDQQKSFRIKDDSEEGNEADEILLMRYSDRFARFALRFCDENEVFEGLRFQINLGKYYFKFYPKTGADGKEYDRQLDKKLKTFGRLREVKERVAAEWKSKGLVKAPDEIEEGHDQPYKTNSTPDYHIVNNQIGIVLSGDSGLPDIGSGEDKVVLKKPDAWLSIYQLPALVFHGLMQSRGFKATEDRIRQYVKQQRECMAEAALTGTVSTEKRDKEFFPKSLLEQKSKTRAAYSERKLKELIKETEDRQNRVEKTLERMADSSNKPGKKRFFDLKAGKLADWLAKDMVKLQPFDPDKNGRDKTTAMNYQVLQESLALFGAKKNCLSRIFKELGLTSGDIQHPFLIQMKSAVSYRSIVDFYKAYLAERLHYLEMIQKERLLNQLFLRPTRHGYASETSDVKGAAARLNETALNLPGDLFKTDIERLVCEESPPLCGQDMNTAYLIQRWFEEKHGQCQPFYAYERTYPIVDKAIEYCKKRDNHRIRTILQQITPEKSYQELKTLIEKSVPESGRFEPEHLRRNLLEGCKDYKDNERILRRYAVEDRVAFMMAKWMFEQEYDVTVTTEISEGSKSEPLNNPEARPARRVLPFKLENICPENESLFRYPMPDSVTQAVFSFNNKVRHEKEYVQHIDAHYAHCEGYLRNDERRELTYCITLTNVKLKDLGKHRKHFNDRRLSGLLIWKWAPNADGKTMVTLADIEEEIKAYQQHRTAIARKLRVFEEKAIVRYGLQPPGEAKYVPFNLIADTVKERLQGCEAECETIIRIRNAVNHNQFPAFRQDIEGVKTREVGGQTVICRYIAEKMLAVTDHYTDKLIERMESGSEEVKYA